MSGAETPPPSEAGLLDERDLEPRTPMKRLGSTRKLGAFNNIRAQLGEQTRVLEARAEATAGVAGELHDWCRRRAELEAEYARALDKLARHGAARARRESWALAGARAAWPAVLDASRALARDHAALAALYGAALAPRLQRAADHAARLHRKCRDVLLERHEEVGAALAAAAAHGKAHAAAHAAWRVAAGKLRAARLARADPPRHRKLKALDKELDKRRARHAAARAAALRARAEYALSLEAANATLQRYYLDDVGDVLLCAEVGFEAVVARALRCAGAAERARAAAAAAGPAAALAAAAAALDALQARQRVLDAHAAAFALPRPLAPPAPQDAADAAELAGEDAEAEAAADAPVLAELAARLTQLDAAALQLRAECHENAKTLDAAEAELVRQMEGDDSQWDVSGLFGAGASAAPPAASAPQPDEQEDYYLAKFRAYATCAGRLARVESKAAALRARLGAGEAAPRAPVRRAPRGRGRFAAPLELRLPRVLTECVRVLAAHGPRQQGVFRVSGSQLEMQALRAAFERGEEPLARAGPADVNCVCGLLKLYLRELRPPLLPPQLQESLLRLAALPDDDAFATRLRATLLGALPAPALLVLRYLFAFLAHLAEHAATTMMDAWNLAVCLGPTLLAAWGDPPHQLAAQNLLNDLVKRTILLHERVFPQDVAPHALYRRPGEEAAPEAGEADEVDARELLALPDEDDSDAEEETSDESEPADWEEHGSPSRRRSSGTEPPPQPADAPAPAPAPAPGTSAGAPCRLAESTPDLVLDLPAAAAPAPPPAPAAPPAPGTLAEPGDPADTFAHNSDTLKRPHSAARAAAALAALTLAASPAPEQAAVPAGGPVAAAAGGQVAAPAGGLKPALAAKPALLRRPTPHPQHARPAPHAPHAD